MKSLLVLLCLSCSAVVATFERSSFPHRSADIIVVPEDIQDDSLVILIDPTKAEKSKEELKIEETNIADLVSNLVGGPIVNSEARLDESLISGHGLFNKAKANLVVFVDGVGSEDLVGDLKIVQQGQKLKLQRVAYPQDSIATFATIMTGHSPSVHGIVGATWKNADGSLFSSYAETFSAYAESNGAKILNLPGQFTQTFDGKPVVISASSNYQMTASMGVNTKNSFGNNFNLFWNERKAAFENVFGNSFGLDITKEAILKEFPSTFEIESKEDFVFVAELAFLKNLVNQLENEHFVALVNDKVPDLFAFSFASLKTIKAHSEASKFNSAMELLDDTLTAVVSKLSTLYSGKVTVEIIFLGKSASEKLALNTELKNTLLAILREDVNEESFAATFPSIYLANPARKQALCSQVRQEIGQEVFCPDTAFEHPVMSAFVTSLAADNGTVPTYQAATTFQTVLWMSIIMVLAVYAAIYAIGTVSLAVPIDPWLQVRDTKDHQS